MKKNEKVCPCGRIIIDPNNKTGLCPKCEKTVGDGAIVVGAGGFALFAKKYGPRIIKGIGNAIRRIKK